MSALRELFGSNVKKFRHMNGLTQAKLAELCGLSSNYIVEIETGRKFPTVEVIETLAKTMRIDAYQLFFNEDASQSTATLIPRNQLVIMKERLMGSLDTIFKDFDLK